MWSYTAQVDESRPLDEHIMALWDVMHPHMSYLHELKRCWKVDVFCGYRSNSGTAGIDVDYRCPGLFIEVHSTSRRSRTFAIFCRLSSHMEVVQSVEIEFVSNVRKAAEESFASGLYCAESVVLALAKAQGIESELLPKVATAFCSGMARTCGPCGALTGAVMGVSLAFGRSSSVEPVQDSYTATQQLIREFEREFGARNCNDLLGCDLGNPEGQLAFREGRLHERCLQYTGKAAEIAARLISEANG